MIMVLSCSLEPDHLGDEFGGSLSLSAVQTNTYKQV